ncbi:MAG: hypothetical protein LBC07_05845, partial [Elusimicrobiota bacterium]|nr:hypothetical protein [Elusimicrobiota bacterium]
IFSGEATLSGDLLIENSFAGFTGGVLTSSVGINNSTASFAGTFKSSDIFIINSLVNFTQTAGASVSAQTISFMNSNAAFSGKSNFTGGILSQDSLLEFLAEVNAGNAMLNRSYITFEKNAILQNLQMAGSTVNFKSAVSTAANLIANDSFIFLQDGIAASSLYVTGDFSLINSRWAIDANFSNIDGGFADWIGVGGNFNISNSTLSVNDLGKGKKILTILTAFNSSIDISSLYITEGYNLKVENNSILLAADALWNSFVKLFNDASSASPIALSHNTSAEEENNPSAFGAPSGNNLVLNGKNNILDSGAYNNLGFIFTNDNANEGKNITFQNTSFVNFKSTLNGAFLFSKGSTVTFMGTAETDGKMSISSNTAISGGAIYAQISSIYFVNGTFEISSNSAIAGGQGGAIWADKSNIVFMNSTAAFYSNKADQEGGAVYLTGSTLAFIKTDIAFYNGESVSNDVFLNSSVLSIEHENNIVQILGGLYVMDESEVLVKGGIGGNIGFVEMSNNLTFENIAKFEIGNSAFIKIIDSTFTYSSNFSPVKLSASTITFTNSSITFLSDTSSDFELDENSALLFNGQNIFTRDLSISGAGFVEKFGAGILSFEGALYAKEISFIVHGGSLSVNAKTEAKDFYVVNTSAVFNDNFDSRDLSFTNSLVNFVGAVNGSSAAIINSSANIKGLANFAGDIFVQDSFMQALAQLNANALSINNSTGVFSTLNLAGNLDSLNSYLSFTDEVLASSINVNNSTAVFAGALKSSAIFINNSLTDFEGVSAGSITMINSSANIKGLANFAGDIFVQDSFMQTLAQLNANAFSINNSTGLFSTANLAGNLDSVNSYLSFTDEVLTSSINVNNSTAVFAGALKSSGIFINNSLTDFGAVSAGSITMINSSASIKGSAN